MSLMKDFEKFGGEALKTMDFVGKVLTILPTCLPKAEKAYKDFTTTQWVDVTSNVTKDLEASLGLSGKKSAYINKSVDNLVGVVKKGISDYHSLEILDMIKDLKVLVKDAEDLAIAVKKEISTVEASARGEAKALSENPFAAGTELIVDGLKIFCSSISEVQTGHDEL